MAEEKNNFNSIIEHVESKFVSIYVNDFTAASAAITVVLGGSAGSTYLYHDQATNSIGAVRL